MLKKMVRIALANLRFPDSPEQAVAKTVESIKAASDENTTLVCFPECYLPGYRLLNRKVSYVSKEFLEGAWKRVREAAAINKINVILGTERIVENKVYISSLVINYKGEQIGFQDKVQLDPSEERYYTPGETRNIFKTESLTFGIVICHEGFRYPETVRWAAQNGAQVVFHPHYSETDDKSYKPVKFLDPSNTFHEKSMLCRAAENSCYFASVNCASYGSPTTSAFIDPEGVLIASQPYDREGLLVADLDLAKATNILARRVKPLEFSQ